MSNRDRAAHSLGVAKLMARLAGDVGVDQGEAFPAGWLHDVGYCAAGDEDHARVGASMLRRGFRARSRIAAVVRSHGAPIDGDYGDHIIIGRLLALLDVCDMSVSSDGMLVSFDERRTCVTSRHGSGSEQAKGFDETLEQVRETRTWSLMEPALELLLADDSKRDVAGWPDEVEA